jgi:hypothetical protein
MRWTAWLVALCLTAAGVVRPVSLRLTDRHASTIDDGSDVAASLAPRRQSTITTDKRSDRRIDVFTLPPGAAAVAPARTVLVAHTGWPVRVAARRTLARSSRGPPLAACGVVDHPVS